jgi:hypothetical protein
MRRISTLGVRHDPRPAANRFVDRAQAGPYRVRLGARRTVHLRFNDLSDPEPVSSRCYASLIQSSMPIVGWIQDARGFMRHQGAILAHAPARDVTLGNRPCSVADLRNKRLFSPRGRASVVPNGLLARNWSARRCSGFTQGFREAAARGPP